MNDEPSEILVAQRIRNRVIEHLELTASFEEQRTYQRSAPIQVPNEIINGWEDLVRDDVLEWFSGPVFTQDEQQAIREFHVTWESVVKDTPRDLPDLEALFETQPWERLRVAAEQALRLIHVRGRFGEEREEF